MHRFILLALFFSSCGYKGGQGSIITEYETVTVPYVKNDVDGFMTRELIRSIASRSPLRVENDEADLILSVDLFKIDEENIGFRYDRHKRGKLIDNIIPVETRLFAKAEITLIQASTGCVVIGPVVIQASYDFDHDYTSPNNAVNIFSLGQLTDYDEAYDAALKPLYHNLAVKIADYISDLW